MNLKKRYLDFIHLIGPGIITAALVFGPGSLTIASKLGGQFQYNLLWVIVLATFFMIVFTVITTRYGFVSQNSLIESIRNRHGKVVSTLVGISIFVVSISFQSGNAIGAGLAFASLFNTSPIPWIICFSILAITTLFFRSFYKILEKMMIVLILIMLLSFLITVVISSPDLSLVVKGFVPRLPKGSELLTIAIIASSFSITGAFYQSYLVQEKNQSTRGIKTSIKESISGILILGAVSSMVLISAGAVLYTNKISINTAADMGRALEPLFGSASFIVFMIGLFAASFSSLIGNATLGGVILADTLSLGKKLSDWSVRLLIITLIITGSVIAILFSDLRLQLIVFAQGFTILIVPFIGFFILRITSKYQIMGEYKNSVLTKILGTSGLILLLGLACGYGYLIFLKN